MCIVRAVMRRLAGVASGVALLLACTGPAAAQNGAGLYEPFPQPAGPSVSRDYIEELRPPGPRLASDALAPPSSSAASACPGPDLPGGEPLPAAVDPAPSGRAEPGAFLGSAVGWLGVAALLVLAALGTRRAALA